MPKLKGLSPANSLTVTQNGFSNLIRDILRNDTAAGQIVLYAQTFATVTNADPFEAANAFPLTNATGGNFIHVGKIQSAGLSLEANDVVALYYEKVGSGFKIGRTSTDTDLTAQIAYGSPDRTTFPSIQQFAEKMLTNTAGRTHLETTDGSYAPTGSLRAIVIEQPTESIWCVFSATAQTDDIDVIAVVDLDDATDVHFGE